MKHSPKQKEIETWLCSIKELSEFRCSLQGPWCEDPWCSKNGYDDPVSPFCLTQFWKTDDYFPSNLLTFWISDTEGRGLMLDIPLDGIASPIAQFYDTKRHTNIEVEFDLSIIDHIQSLIERFPGKFFMDHLQAAIYYSNNNIKKAFDELRLSIESDFPYNLEDYKGRFPREFRNSYAFKKLMKQSSDRYKKRYDNREQ